MKKTSIVIVGQGIAGSLVAFMLHQEKIPFVVIDPGLPNSASLVAAGMFSPVSGKRKVIHTAMLQQIPFAVSIYQQLEQLISKRILYQQDIYQVFNSLEEKNDLLGRMANEDLEKFLYLPDKLLPAIKQDNGVMGISHSGWIDCTLFIKSFREWLLQKEALVPTEFIYEDLQVDKEILRYHEMEFKQIIFCEGYRVFNNPFFNHENIIPCKGDILTIKYKNPDIDHIVKKNDCYLISQGNNIFKAGSTYQWNNNNEALMEANRKEISGKLDTLLEKEYMIINHQTGIRPTTKNREVIAKQHPVYLSMFMLNGLGTKGIIQGPWWAKHIVELMKTADQ